MDMETIKRYSLIEIVLLAIFMMGMLIASLIVKRRNKVVLSDPLPLTGSGLSVSMPANPGWEFTSAWQYEGFESNMVLVGQYRSPGRGTIEVRWQYLLSTPQGSEQALLNQQAERAGAVVMDFETAGQAHPMTFARMLSGVPGDREEFYLGILRLDYNRSIELLVKSPEMSFFYEESIFRALAKSIQYEPSQQLAEGRVLMDTFLQSQSKTQGQAAFPDESFVIKDPLRGDIAGYYAMSHSLDTDEEQTLSRIQIRQFKNKSFKLDSSLWFDPLGRNYRWRSDVMRPGITATLKYEILKDQTRGLSIKRDVKGTRTFPGGQFFLPEPLLPELARWFLKSNSNEVVVDVIRFQGQLVPVCLKKISLEKGEMNFADADTAVLIQFLHARNSYEKLFFDKSLNLLGKIEQESGRGAYIWISSSMEEIQRIFQMDNQKSHEMITFNF